MNFNIIDLTSGNIGDFLQLLNSFSDIGADNLDPFENLKKELQYTLDDSEKAEVLTNLTKKHFSKIQLEFTHLSFEEFKSWLVSVAVYLGSLSVNHIQLALKTFPHSILSSFSTPQNYQFRYTALENFFKDLQKEWGTKQAISFIATNNNKTMQSTTNFVKNILILWRSCGSGHKTASLGLKDLLEKKGYNIFLYDGMLTEDDLSFFMLSDQMKKFKDMVKLLHPDLIINTVAHHNRVWRQLSYDLRIPTIVVHTDYEIVNSSIKSDDHYYYHYENAKLVKHCLPFTVQDVKCYSIMKDFPLSLSKGLMNITGFPIRKAFKREVSQINIVNLRQQMGVRPNERVVLILGVNNKDKRVMVEIIQAIYFFSQSFPFPIYIVGVLNEIKDDLDNTLVEFVKQYYHPQIRGKIETKLDENQLANYMKIISRVSSLPGLMISKSGGSTTAESIEMGVYNICLPTKDQEACNREYLKEKKLGELYEKSNIVQQVINALSWKGDPHTIYHPNLDWQNKIVELVEQQMRNSLLTKLGYDQFLDN